jgi:hypothetical protein
MPANPNQVPVVNHKLVETHLTTWEDHDRVNVAVPHEESVIEEDHGDEKAKMTVSLDLRKSIAIENQTVGVIDHGRCSNVTNQEYIKLYFPFGNGPNSDDAPSWIPYG